VEPLCCPAVPAFKSTHIEAYVFRRRRGRVEFLCLRRASGRALPGVWQPVTGRIERRESALAAAVREVREETGLSPSRWWVLESPVVFYDPVADAIEALPLFAAEVPATARVILSSEHDAHAFLAPPAAGRRFLWDAQRIGLAAVRRTVLAGGALAAALEVPAPRSRPSPAPARKKAAARTRRRVRP
jgi:dihydroneopterin triphosphate diphosphatase